MIRYMLRIKKVIKTYFVPLLISVNAMNSAKTYFVKSIKVKYVPQDRFSSNFNYNIFEYEGINL